MARFIILMLLVAESVSCDDEKEECAPADRLGAVCKDGTTTPVTGRGACSGHGGVEYWQCR